MRWGLLIVPAPSGGGLGWRRLPGGCKAVGKQDFTLTPALSTKREGELKDPGYAVGETGRATLVNILRPVCRGNPDETGRPWLRRVPTRRRPRQVAITGASPFRRHTVGAATQPSVPVNFGRPSFYPKDRRNPIAPTLCRSYLQPAAPAPRPEAARRHISGSCRRG